MRHKIKNIAALIAGSMSLVSQGEELTNNEIFSSANTFSGLDKINIRALNTELPLYIAAHRSHASHSSHSSHRSSSGTYSSPSYSPPPPTPAPRSYPLGQPAQPSSSYATGEKSEMLKKTMDNKEKLANLIMRVQLTLQSIGYYYGSIDGSMGPKTREALNIFRATKGLPANEKLDVETLNALAISIY